MNKLFISFLAIIAAVITCITPASGQDSLLKYVDPFVGTGGHGHTFPGAAMPFGMVQLSPDTRLSGWDGCSGYHYSDSIIYGFSHTHLSGTGVSDYGDVLFMPVSGEPFLENGAADHRKGYASGFSHDSESASPGSYSVLLKDYDISVDLTATERAGFHRYRFNNQEKAHHIVLDLEHRDMVLASELTIINDSVISGKRISKAWANEQHIYFYAAFSRPFNGFITNREEQGHAFSGKDIKAAFTFGQGAEVMLKVGISAVDVEGARKNLEKEIPHWEFNRTMKAARDIWEQELSKIKVTGSTKSHRINFYTALYHAFLHPNIYHDVDGRYRGRDMNIHQLAEGEEHYTVFSLWDTFRAAHPLFTILQKKRTNHFIKTMLRQYQQGGRLPVWELAANETDCMIGYHAVPVIADAFLKGLDDYDAPLALEAMVHSAREDRYGLEAYKRLGYIPSSEEGESVSKTLEYAFDDWCIATMASKMGADKVHQEFIKRGQYWKNIYDPQTRFMRAKVHADWFEPFDPAEVNFHYTEANAWQYNFFVPQDVNTMIDWMGGNRAFDSFLTELFTTSSETKGRHQADITGLIGQYAHGNEPSHHMAYLFSYAEKPWKTQERVREIMETMYAPIPDGLSGNEDCGQMSAWYVFSAMGFYPVTPGAPQYILGSPLFDKMTLNLENGNQFVITTSNQSAQNIYIDSMWIDGKACKKAYLDHKLIDEGATVTFKMDDEPHPEWFRYFPQQRITAHSIVPVPFAARGERTFRKSTQVVLSCADPEAKIYYATDNSEKDDYRLFKEPLQVDSTITIRFYAQRGTQRSAVVQSSFTKIHGSRHIMLQSEYAEQYAAGGNNALIDGLKGGANFKTGSWQGFQGQDMVATVDLGNVSRVQNVTAGFLQDSRSWILLPKTVTLYVSDDGKSFRKADKKTHDISPMNEQPLIKRFSFEADTTTRYIKIVAEYPGDLPRWHLGAGGQSWIFSDEIEIR